MNTLKFTWVDEHLPSQELLGDLWCLPPGLLLCSSPTKREKGCMSHPSFSPRARSLLAPQSPLMMPLSKEEVRKWYISFKRIRYPALTLVWGYQYTKDSMPVGANALWGPSYSGQDHFNMRGPICPLFSLSFIYPSCTFYFTA